MATSYDAIIIGSGAGGLTAADRIVVIEEWNHDGLLAQNEHDLVGDD